MACSGCVATEPLTVTAVRQQYSGMLGEQRGAQSPQGCHTSGQLPSERDQLHVQHGEDLVSAPEEAWASMLCSGANREACGVGVGCEMTAAFPMFL